MDRVYTQHGKISQCIVAGGNDSLQNEPRGMKCPICVTFERHTHTTTPLRVDTGVRLQKVNGRGAAEVQLHTIVSLALLRRSFAFYNCKRELPTCPPRARQG